MGAAMWIETEKELPPDGEVVKTKISDQHGERNEGELQRRGRLWFLPDGSMYVYFQPTHWARIGGAA